MKTYSTSFFVLLGILNENVLDEPPNINVLASVGNPEEDAARLRGLLGFAKNGPLPNIMDIIENKGILLCSLLHQGRSFSGLNGLVHNRPYIALNNNMTTERQRSTLAHELAHLFFHKPSTYSNKWEKYIEAVTGAFLFPKENVLKELGLKRTGISSDMLIVSQEYRISINLLAKRAYDCGVISDGAYRWFNIKQSREKQTRVKEAPRWIEKPRLFLQLALRALNEGKITEQRCAELLGISSLELRESSLPDFVFS